MRPSSRIEQAPQVPWPSQPLRTERRCSRRSRSRTRSPGWTSNSRGVPLTLTEIFMTAPRFCPRASRSASATTTPGLVPAERRTAREFGGGLKRTEAASTGSEAEEPPFAQAAISGTIDKIVNTHLWCSRIGRTN